MSVENNQNNTSNIINEPSFSMSAWIKEWVSVIIQILKNNFKRFEELAKTDKDIEKVLKTYSQKYLISGSNILLVCLEAIPEVNNKKLYFAKEGQIAWLVSYVADRSKKVKKILLTD